MIAAAAPPAPPVGGGAPYNPPVGDANTGSLLTPPAGGLRGAIDFVITHPEGYELDPQFVKGARVEYDQMKAFEGADFVYAKNWSCPGVTRPEDYGKVLHDYHTMMDWCVSARQMAVTNDAHFMHCLPVRRNMIVTDDVIEGPRSLVIPEAANREISAQVVLKRMLESLN